MYIDCCVLVDVDEVVFEGVFLIVFVWCMGCGILLDLNNLYVNSVNYGVIVEVVFVDIDFLLVGEIYLVGFSEEDGMLIDMYSVLVYVFVWVLYDVWIVKYGVCLMLIEWDVELFFVYVLLDEVVCV